MADETTPPPEEPGKKNGNDTPEATDEQKANLDDEQLETLDKVLAAAAQREQALEDAGVTEPVIP
jgi:hypothetical protein